MSRFRSGKFRDPDSSWKLQNKEQTENRLYEYINLQRRGKLVDVFVGEGAEALREVIRGEIGLFLYNNGAGRIVSRSELLRWREQIEAKLNGIQVKSSGRAEAIKPSRHDKDASLRPTTLNKEGRETCWQLSKRGSVGETLLHLALLFAESEPFSSIAEILLEIYPKMAIDVYEGDEYCGESGLHLAIVFGNMKLVRLLVSCGANISQRATGRFFLPDDQKSRKPKKNTNYMGSAYYGEYPLAFAACCERVDMYDFLISSGADPNVQDSFGNTVLHLMVICNLEKMFNYALSHTKMPASLHVSNKQSLTPLTLASKLGRMAIFNTIIELQSHEVWRYSNVSCSVYPLEPLDTIGEHGETNWSSALRYLTDGDTDEHLEMLEGGIIKQLLDDKWKYFARRRFLERLFVILLHLIILSIAVYLRPDVPQPTFSTDAESIVRYICEAIVCIDCAVSLLLQILEMRSQGLIGFLKYQKSAPAKCLFYIGCILILVCIPIRLVHLELVERTILAFAVPCSWAFLLFCARGFNLTGVFVVVFYRMLGGDIARFGLIYVIFLPGFALSFYFIYKVTNNTRFNTIDEAAMTVFQMSLGEYKYPEFAQTPMPALTKFVFVVFATFVPILLLNMLVATFVTTYERIISRSEKEWKRQWAKIIIILERSYSLEHLKKVRQSYSVPFSSNPVGCGPKACSREKNCRGLMVIKAMPRTKAHQRKCAVACWRRLLSLMKKCNFMSNDSLMLRSATFTAEGALVLRPHESKAVGGRLSLSSETPRGVQLTEFSKHLYHKSITNILSRSISPTDENSCRKLQSFGQLDRSRPTFINKIIRKASCPVNLADLSHSSTCHGVHNTADFGNLHSIAFQNADQGKYVGPARDRSLLRSNKVSPESLGIDRSGTYPGPGDVGRESFPMRAHNSVDAEDFEPERKEGRRVRRKRSKRTKSHRTAVEIRINVSTNEIEDVQTETVYSKESNTSQTVVVNLGNADEISSTKQQ